MVVWAVRISLRMLWCRTVSGCVTAFRQTFRFSGICIHGYDALALSHTYAVTQVLPPINQGTRCGRHDNLSHHTACSAMRWTPVVECACRRERVMELVISKIPFPVTGVFRCEQQWTVVLTVGEIGSVTYVVYVGKTTPHNNFAFAYVCHEWWEGQACSIDVVYLRWVAIGDRDREGAEFGMTQMSSSTRTRTSAI